MIPYTSVQKLHLELSTYCQAECPFCPRNLYGYKFNGGYPLEHMTLENLKKVLSVNFIKQLKEIYLCGNFGDPALNPQTPDIVEYLFSVNNDLTISMSTNGSIQKPNYWKRLYRVKIDFGLDGLEDTHNLYRRKTNFNLILKNAKAHIDAGGYATWKFIKFDHNKHQIDKCRNLSTILGFSDFKLVEEARTNGPVYDTEGNLERIIGNWTHSTDISFWKTMAENPCGFYEEDMPDIPTKTIDCQSTSQNEIYISANFEVYPCCYMGFYPESYTDAHFYQAVNRVLRKYISGNNALKFGLEHSMKWFDNMRSDWENNRLYICKFSCGKCQ